MKTTIAFIFFLILVPVILFAKEIPLVKTGIETLIEVPGYRKTITGKKIGLVTNQTGVTSSLESNIEYLLSHSKEYQFELAAIFAPEHGITGASHAAEKIQDTVSKHNIPIYSLHGKSKRPSKKMLSDLDVIIFDIQDIGSRSYTYATTLFYMMEEAKKNQIPMIVTDRPNPINGLVVDGPMLKDKYRSFLGYVAVPYCHGMTIGELASLFNQEHKVNCSLTVVPMKGWKRAMNFESTGLPWIPTSPNIPEATTSYFYPMTGILGELQMVNIGIGYTLPFKIVGAPWIDAEQFAAQLNRQKLQGVHFQPFHYKPLYGKFNQQDCHGILIIVTDPSIFRPVTTQYTILGMLKSLYPKQFKLSLEASSHKKELFNKVNGTDIVFKTIEKNPYPAWSLRELSLKESKSFLATRKKYLNPLYD